MKDLDSMIEASTFFCKTSWLDDFQFHLFGREAKVLEKSPVVLST